MAEQLRLDESRWHRTAVEGDERPVAARAGRVNPLREELLARTGLAEEKDGDLGQSGALEPREQSSHRDGRADCVTEPHLHRERYIDRSAEGTDDELRRPHEDRDTEGHAGALDLDPSDERAVLAGEVLDDDPPRIERESAVAARDARVGEHDVAVRVNAHDDRRHAEGDALVIPDAYLEHRQLEAIAIKRGLRALGHVPQDIAIVAFRRRDRSR